jgi:glycolate oxidase iron-sulfur subunit
MNGPIFTPELLNQCISCGFCLPACPTYRLTADEGSSPRGRITLMRAVQSGQLSLDDPDVTEQASQCLGCRACEPVCPAGVRYGELLEEWRAATWTGRRRPLLVRALLLIADRRLPIAALGLLRRAAASRRRPQGPHLLLGCFERLLYPRVSRAAVRLLPELSAPPGQGCCGALHAHNGELTRGQQLAHRLGEVLPGVIITTSGGCAAHLAQVLGRDRVRDISQVIAGTFPQTSDAVAPLSATVDGRRLRVTLQDSCHLRNGLGVFREPRQLLAGIADYVEVDGAAECCGAAGTYSMLRRAESRRLLAEKLDAIEAAGVDLIVAVNPGCLRQLRGGLRRRSSKIRAVHLVELLEWMLSRADVAPVVVPGRRQLAHRIGRLRTRGLD